MRASFFTKKLHERVRLEIERVLRQFRSGVHRSALTGAGVEFRRLRPYNPFDPPGAIDDMASARLSENPDFELYSRVRYRPKQISVITAIDVGESMREPPAKESHAAMLFWFFALSTFKTADRFRLIPFAGAPLHDSDWTESEEGLEGFLSYYTMSDATRAELSRFRTIFSYVADLNLHDALVVVISDFCWAWGRTSTLLRRIGLFERNVKMIFCALDEWEGFTPTGYGAEIRDPRTGARRHASETELIQLKASASRHLTIIQESVRPLGIPLLTFSLLDNPLTDAKRRFLRLGFR